MESDKELYDQEQDERENICYDLDDLKSSKFGMRQEDIPPILFLMLRELQKLNEVLKHK